MGELEEALTLERVDDGCWRAFPDHRYVSTNAMYGGWTTAVALKSVLESSDGAHRPSAITVNFVDRIEPGADVIITVRRVGGGRSIGHWQSELSSADGSPRALASVVLTDRRDTDGLTVPPMPVVPDPESLGELHPPGSQGEPSMIRPIVGQPPFGRPDTYSAAWIREMTGRPVDRVQLAFLADQCAPRSWFWSEAPRPSATMTMSVYFYATDDELAAVGDDYILNEAVATRGVNATSGQQVRMWSRRGELLATSEQLCWYR